MDTLSPHPAGALYSPAASRNLEPILDVLKAHLGARARILEIASGTGQHAAGIATALPGLDWTPSDPDDASRHSIAAWAGEARTSNIRPALPVNAMDGRTWPEASFDALVCLNMIHISPWAATLGLFKLADKVLPRRGGLIYLYGPYREADRLLAASNASFDESLKARNPDWGIRQREEVEKVARQHGFQLTLRREMPANNLSLIFRRV